MCVPTRSARFIHRLGVVLLAIGSMAGRASAQTTVTLSTPGTHISVDTTIRDGAYASTNYSSSDTLVSKARRRRPEAPDAAQIRHRKLHSGQCRHPERTPVSGAQDRRYQRAAAAHGLSRHPLLHEDRHAAGTISVRGDAWTTPGGDVQGSFGTTWVGGGAGTTYTFDLTSLVQRSVKGEFGSRWTRVELD